MRSVIVPTRISRFIRFVSAFILICFIALFLLCACTGEKDGSADSVKSDMIGDPAESSEFASKLENDNPVSDSEFMSETAEEDVVSEPEEDSIPEPEPDDSETLSTEPSTPVIVPPTLNENGEITEVTDDWLLLVNKTHPLSESYEPTDLIVVKHQVGSHAAIMRYMRQEAAEHLDAMCEAAAEAGHEMGIRTAYRPYSYQKAIFNDYAARYGEEEANKFSARPGQSEHQTGLCADVTSPSVDYKLTTDYGKAPEGIWLAENAHKFGFIIRYPLGKEDITGYQYEPWHVRYVGVEDAGQIYERGITLEEYLGILD